MDTVTARALEFNEADHPRGTGDQGGQFVEKGTGGGSASSPSARQRYQPPTSKPDRFQRGPSRTGLTEVTAVDTDLTRAADPGSGGGRTYQRVLSGEHGGEFATTNTYGPSRAPLLSDRPYAVKPKGGGGGKAAPTAPSSAKFKTLSADGDNDPQAVAEMQQLLTALGLGNLSSGVYDSDTENAVKEAQRRLGVKNPNGKANKALVNKMLNAYDLSPCIQRSADCDDTFTVTRSEGDVFDTLREFLADDEVEVVERAELSSAEINDLPDSDFAYIEPGGTKDSEGKTVPRSLRHFPVHDEAHVRNALSRASQSPFGDKAMPKIRAAAKKFGIGDDSSRSELWTSPEIMRYERSYFLDGIEILRNGDGRTVEAYAAVFDTPSEIKDQHGHYMEIISRSAFNRAISHGIDRINVFYHHGMTLHGTPSDLGAVPIGSPVDIRPDGRGLRTVTRFNRSQLADSVLEAIRDGNIRGYSFRGRVFQSNPPRIPRAQRNGPLPTITRTELGLAEYGPTPTPAYAESGIVAVRSLQAIATTLATLDNDERAELVRMLAVSTPRDPETETATPDVGPGTEDSPDGRSGRLQQFREELRKRGVLK